MSEILNLILYYIINDNIICNRSAHAGKDIHIHIIKQL